MTDKTNQPDGVREVVDAIEAALAFYDKVAAPHHPGEPEILDRLQAALSALKASVPWSLEGEKEGLSSAREPSLATGGSCEVATYNTTDMTGWVLDTLMAHKVPPALQADLAAHLVKSFETTLRVTDAPASHDQQTAKGQVPGGQQGLTASPAPALDGHCQAETETLGVNAELLEALTNAATRFEKLAEGCDITGLKPTAEAARKFAAEARAAIARAESRS